MVRDDDKNQSTNDLHKNKNYVHVLFSKCFGFRK